jgi:hypothetical protein
MTTTETYAEQRRRGAAYGWTFVASNRCPVHLTDDPCHHSTPVAANDSICDWDRNWTGKQSTTWRDDAGAEFTLWEVAGIEAEDLVALIKAAHEAGLMVEITGKTVSDRSDTFGVKFSARECNGCPHHDTHVWGPQADGGDCQEMCTDCAAKEREDRRRWAESKAAVESEFAELRGRLERYDS